MCHLREDCNIKIEGKTQKQDLINYGYYHGYKGYRFYQNSRNKIAYTDFKELVAVIVYDNNLKAELYSSLMFLETAIKNIVCNTTVIGLDSSTFDYVYKKRMNDNNGNIDIQKNRLKLRNTVYSMLLQQYSREKNQDNQMVRHFYKKGEDVPLWVIFEIFYLSDLAAFFDCLNIDTRERILKELKIFDNSIDTNRNLLSGIIYTLKDLRNAMAHNGVIFDTRFRCRKINKVLKKWTEKETGINNISLNSLADYIIIICCLLKRIDYTGKIAEDLLITYKSENERLKRALTTDIYNTIIQKNVAEKMNKLAIYLKN